MTLLLNNLLGVSEDFLDPLVKRAVGPLRTDAINRTRSVHPGAHTALGHSASGRCHAIIRFKSTLPSMIGLAGGRPLARRARFQSSPLIACAGSVIGAGAHEDRLSWRESDRALQLATADADNTATSPM